MIRSGSRPSPRWADGWASTPAMPAAARHRDVLTRTDALLLAVEQVGEPPLQNVELLVDVVVNVLAAGDETALFHGEFRDDTRAPAVRGRFDEQSLLGCQRAPDHVTCASACTHARNLQQRCLRAAALAWSRPFAVHERRAKPASPLGAHRLVRDAMRMENRWLTPSYDAHEWRKP
jgi:hypothetical protein